MRLRRCQVTYYQILLFDRLVSLPLYAPLPLQSIVSRSVPRRLRLSPVTGVISIEPPSEGIFSHLPIATRFRLPEWIRTVGLIVQVDESPA